VTTATTAPPPGVNGVCKEAVLTGEARPAPMPVQPEHIPDCTGEQQQYPCGTRVLWPPSIDQTQLMRAAEAAGIELWPGPDGGVGLACPDGWSLTRLVEWCRSHGAILG
jgi:hypothetical protein